MGTRRQTCTTRNTRKKKGGVWTPNKQRSVKRRQNLLNYTSNSTQKSNKARQAVQEYLEATHEENSNDAITYDDVIYAITPDIVRQKGSLTDYIPYAINRCRDLIEAKVKALMAQKKAINEKRRLSKQATFLANRAALRAQQAAHIASLSRLSNSSVQNVPREVEEWNRTADQRKSNQENKKAALLINQNKSSTKIEEIRLRYELTEQIVEQIKRLDYIIPLYESHNNNTTMTQIVEQARGIILVKIPAFKGVSYIDRVLPIITEELYGMLLDTLQKYIVDVKTLTTVETLKGQLQFYNIKKEQMEIAKHHFIILSTAWPKLRSELARNPLINEHMYHTIVTKIKELNEQIKQRERS
jgi:hypothetical protein